MYNVLCIQHIERHFISHFRNTLPEAFTCILALTGFLISLHHKNVSLPRFGCDGAFPPLLPLRPLEYVAETGLFCFCG